MSSPPAESRLILTGPSTSPLVASTESSSSVWPSSLVRPHTVLSRNPPVGRGCASRNAGNRNSSRHADRTDSHLDDDDTGANTATSVFVDNTRNKSS